MDRKQNKMGNGIPYAMKAAIAVSVLVVSAYMTSCNWNQGADSVRLPATQETETDLVKEADPTIQPLLIDTVFAPGNVSGETSVETINAMNLTEEQVNFYIIYGGMLTNQNISITLDGLKNIETTAEGGKTYHYDGRDYAPVFDAEFYEQKYPHLKTAFDGNKRALFLNFLFYGMKEGRQGSSAFLLESYRNEYAVWRREYGSDYLKYYLRYIDSGIAAGEHGTGSENILHDACTVYEGTDYAAVYDFSQYTKRYPEVLEQYGLDEMAVLKDFVTTGIDQNRQGNDEFLVMSYYNEYADLRRQYQKDYRSYYLHYIRKGKAEGRNGTGSENVLHDACTVYEGTDYAAVYDFDWYTQKYPEILEQYGLDEMAVLKDFVTTGIDQSRQGNEEFLVMSYHNEYPDLRKIYKKDYRSYYLHYINYGKAEGRNGTGFEQNLNGATTVYQDVDYSDVYDFYYYTKHYPEVLQQFGYDEDLVIADFVEEGMPEGRRGNALFDLATYKKRYPEHKSKCRNNVAWYRYYMTKGKAAGENPDPAKKFVKVQAPKKTETTVPVAGRGEQASGNSNTNQASGNSNTNQASGNSNTNQASGNGNTNQASGNGNTNQASGNSNTNQASGNSNTNQASGNSNTNQASGNGNTNQASGNGNTNQASGNSNTNQASGNGNSVQQKPSDGKYEVAGASLGTPEKLIAFYLAKGGRYPSHLYADKGAPTLEVFCQKVYDISCEEGIRSEVVFAQICVETGFLLFGGDVKGWQCNFAALGATGGGEPGLSFPNVDDGLRAQIRHLKLYTGIAGVSQSNYQGDPRYTPYLYGKAPYVEWLSIPHNPYGVGWAANPNYGYEMRALITQITRM